jgi:hypothetical protein
MTAGGFGFFRSGLVSCVAAKAGAAVIAGSSAAARTVNAVLRAVVFRADTDENVQGRSENMEIGPLVVRN